MAIDIGEEAKDRASDFGGEYTWIAKDNPANASGTITSVEIWAYYKLKEAKIGIFYTTNGNTLKCRSVAEIGEVTAGSKQTFSGLSLAVETGDYIGLYQSYYIGSIERDTEGYAGVWYLGGADHCVVDDEAEYSLLADDAISLYGTGEEAAPPVGRSFGFIIG